MNSAFGYLIGHRVIDASIFQDYLQIRFDNESTLNIFNRFKTSFSENEQLDLLIGCAVTSFDSDNDKIEICFWPAAKILIGLSDEDYIGPEAMEYVPKSGPTVIWN